MLAKLLSDEGHAVSEASSGEEALTLFKKEGFPLVITDLKMSGMSGTDLMKEIRGLNPDTQFIIMTSYASLDTAIMAVRLGAYDYLARPFDDVGIVSTVVNRAVDKIRLIEKNHALIEDLEENNRELKRANEVLKEMAIRDSLTMLYNHRYFHEALSLEVLRARRYDRSFSLIMLDIDFFKHYNDTHGHPGGDKLLLQLTRLFSERMRGSDIIARYGGEEFVMILPETSKDNALVVAEGIRKQIEDHPFDGRDAQPSGKVTISVGVAVYPDNGEDPPSLIKHADDALYKAKKGGRNMVCH